MLIELDEWDLAPSSHLRDLEVEYRKASAPNGGGKKERVRL